MNSNILDKKVPILNLMKVNKLPSLEVQKIKHGRWLHRQVKQHQQVDQVRGEIGTTVKKLPGHMRRIVRYTNAILRLTKQNMDIVVV